MTPCLKLLRFPATIPALASAASQLGEILEGLALSRSRRHQIELAFDEVVSNIIRHGRPAEDIEVAVALAGTELVLTFDDDGRPFDPRTHRPRTMDTDLEHAQVGGLGIGLVRAFATRFDYEQTPRHHNRLTVAIPIT